LKKPKENKAGIVSDTCRLKCSIYGCGKLCMGRLLADESCLGYKPKNEKVPTVNGNAENVSQADTVSKKPIKLYTFESRNATLKGNNSICDDCLHELDGLCKLFQRVNLSTIKSCNEFTLRNSKGAVI